MLYFKESERMKVKAKLSLMLVLVMLVSAFAAVPAAASDEEGTGGKFTYWLCNKKASCKMEAEAGESFYMNRLLEKWTDKKYWMAVPVTGKWKSSNKKVASVSGKDGLVKAKKAGKAKISVKFNGKTYTCTLTVKKKGKLIKGDYKKLVKQDAAFKKYASSKITKANFIKASNAVKAYKKFCNKLYAKLNPTTGTLWQKPTRIIHQVLYAEKAAEKVYLFAQDQLPGAFRIKSVKKNSANQLTITLTKPVSALQYAMLEHLGQANEYETSGLQFDKMIVTEYDDDGEPMAEENETVHVWGYCKFVKGSSKVVVKRSSGSSDTFEDVTNISVLDGYFSGADEILVK